MVKVVWIIVLVAHIALLLALTVAYVDERGLTHISDDFLEIALFIGIWIPYLVALLGSSVKGDTLLGLAIEARKAELRKRIRELRDAE